MDLEQRQENKLEQILLHILDRLNINANYQSTATITYPMLALSGFWAYWRITVISRE